MSKTPFSNRVNILGDFYAQVAEDDYMRSTPLLQDYNDTLWICLAAKVNYVTINERFHWAVDDAWQAFCDYLGVDSFGEYNSFDEMMEFAYAE